MMNESKPRDGFYRDRETIARHVAAANKDVSNDPTAKRSEQTWETISAMAWRPAWSIRSRKGTLSVLLEWWKNR
ncbi:MAG: hypothetical protein ACRBC3_01125 [Burkholderiaceae bacterium]